MQQTVETQATHYTPNSITRSPAVFVMVHLLPAFTAGLLPAHLGAGNPDLADCKFGQVPHADKDLYAAAVLDQQPLDQLPAAAREVLQSLPRLFALTVGQSDPVGYWSTLPRTVVVGACKAAIAPWSLG